MLVVLLERRYLIDPRTPHTYGRCGGTRSESTSNLMLCVPFDSSCCDPLLLPGVGTCRCLACAQSRTMASSVLTSLSRSLLAVLQ